MEIWNELHNKIWQSPSVVMIGKFDGMHRGHQVIEKKVLEIANDQGLTSIAICFDMSIPNTNNSNNSIANISTNSRELMTLNEKISYFQNAGFDLFINCPFDNYLRTMSREDFLQEILLKNLNVKHIVVGEDFYFGYKAAGNAGFIKKNEELGYKACIIKPLTYIDEKVSSSRIRECIQSGEMENANAMLGYKYSFKGNVVHGNHIGSAIDLPTINLKLDKSKLLPPFGVYTGECVIDKKSYRGVVNIGVKPTLGDHDPNIEIHLIDFNDDVYDETVTILIDKFIRPERKFDSLNDLKKQILEDIKQI